MGRLDRFGERVHGLGVAVDEVADPLPEPTGPGPASRLGAQDPAPKIGRFAGRKVGRERAVGGVEQVMALVEDIAGRKPVFAAGASGKAAQGGLDHHQGMIGDDDIGAPGPAHRVFDETAAVMPARRIDAFAPGVRQIQGRAVAQQIGEPGREIAADHVAVPGVEGPAGHQAERRGGAATRLGAAAPSGRPGQRLVEIQKAEVILPPLADDDPVGLFRRVGEQPVELAVQLPLQVAGKGADPHRTLVHFRPHAGRGDVTQGLADPGAGLGDDQPGLAGLVAGLEGGRGVGRVMGLLVPVFGTAAQKLGQPGPRLGRFHRPGSGRRFRRPVLPFVEQMKDV